MTPERKKQSKITLSVSPEFKAFALQLKKKKRRSITKLFEDWIEEQMNEEQANSRVFHLPSAKDAMPSKKPPKKMASSG